MNGECSPAVVALDRLSKWHRKNGYPRTQDNFEKGVLTMNKYTKIVSFDVGTERPTTEYCEQLEAEIAKLNYIELPNENVSNVFEAYLAWLSKATQLEAENEKLREALC